MVTFERTMTIIYDAMEWNDVEELGRQLQYLLHLEGLHQTSRYNWNAKIDESLFGYHTTEDTDYDYPVYINDDESFRLKYQSQAELAVEGLIASGHPNARCKTETITTKKDEWMRVRGAFFIFDFDGLEGEVNMHGNPSLIYGPYLNMITTLEPKAEGMWELEFKITFEAETAEDRKEAATKLVDEPLSDMRHIRTQVEGALSTFLSDCQLEFTVDCVSCIKSETTAKCEPVTIEKVMHNE